jgi:hypothetical protein
MYKSPSRKDGRKLVVEKLEVAAISVASAEQPSQSRQQQPTAETGFIRVKVDPSSPPSLKIVTPTPYMPIQ